MSQEPRKTVDKCTVGKAGITESDLFKLNEILFWQINNLKEFYSKGAVTPEFT